MNKKNKRKQARKILPVILAFVMMLSLTVSVFAEEIGACSGRHSDLTYMNDIFLEDEFIDVICRSCGGEWHCKFVSIDGEAHCDKKWKCLYVDSVSQRDDGLFNVGLWASCTCGLDEEDFYVCAIAAPVVEEAEEKGMIGSMVETLTDSLGGILTGVGASIVSFFDATVLTTNEAGETQLTTFAVWALAFLGIGFGLGVVKFITNIVRKR